MFSRFHSLRHSPFLSSNTGTGACLQHFQSSFHSSQFRFVCYSADNTTKPTQQQQQQTTITITNIVSFQQIPQPTWIDKTWMGLIVWHETRLLRSLISGCQVVTRNKRWHFVKMSKDSAELSIKEIFDRMEYGPISEGKSLAEVSSRVKDVFNVRNFL